MSDDAESGGDYDLEGYHSDDSHESGLEDNGFFDMEAAESGDESERFDRDSASKSSDDSERSPSPLSFESRYFGGPTSFPQFLELPPELRYQIWDLFCPDLVAKARLFNFTLAAHNVIDGPYLVLQTAAARAVLATHRDSRAFALRALPDTLPFSRGQNVIRFNRDKDIVLLTPHNRSFDKNYAKPWGGFLPSHLSLFAERISYLAVQVECWPEIRYDNPSPPWSPESPRRETYKRIIAQNFCNLKAVYFVHDADERNPVFLPWFQAAEKVSIYHFKHYEEESGIGEDLDVIYTWPDPAESQGVSMGDFTLSTPGKASSEDDGCDTDAKNIEPRCVPVYDLLHFCFESGVEMFQRLMEWRTRGGELDWEWASSESGSETDEYESEGIDDEALDSDSNASGEEQDDLAVLPPSEDELDGGSSIAEHVSISSSSSDVGDSEKEFPTMPQPSDYPVATFSSPEVEHGSSATLEGNGSDSSSSEDSPVRMVNRPKRRIESSEGDNDSEVAQATKRPAKRVRVLLSDSDDDDDGNDAQATKTEERPSKHAHVVLSDSEDDSDDE